MLNEVAVGHGNTGGLQTILVQPDFDGLQYPREIYAANGDVFRDGSPFVELRFPNYVSAEDWTAILAQFGLASDKTALVTIRLMDEDKTSRTIFNGRAVKQEYGQVVRWDICWYVSPVVVVKRLVEI